MKNEYLNNFTFEKYILDFQLQVKKVKRLEMIMDDFQETYDRRKKHYNDDTKLEILEEAKAEYGKTVGQLIEKQKNLSSTFHLLAENITHRYYYLFNGIDVEDAIQEGVLICFEKVDRFNPHYKSKYGKKAKAFNYMTTCIINHYRQIYRSIKNFNEFKKKYLLRLEAQSKRPVRGRHDPEREAFIKSLGGYS